MNKNNKEIYNITLKDDKSLKQFFQRFYILPKKPNSYNYTNKELEILKLRSLKPTCKEVKQGLNGYIVFRGVKNKKLTEQQVKDIQNSNLSQRKLAKEYNVSVGTINRVKNNKY
ncbi:helix-turn-helix domain-containing protein [Clostridium sp.]|uniref:helix-turn-helix domain-containing protein n=1 Tax=Clostridium sp. TaxID=1506 RepID=UPI0026DA7A5A|nr:helix-turn-helix domain-containing protein [Clostridium sp.]MDO5040113.1 helix-turn-helix domain-containing protein [Clostridium sp.]